MDKLYNYFFHFNSLAKEDGLWAAVPRDKSAEYYNNMTRGAEFGVYYSPNIEDLVKFIATKEVGHEKSR